MLGPIILSIVSNYFSDSDSSFEDLTAELLYFIRLRNFLLLLYHLSYRYGY